MTLKKSWVRKFERQRTLLSPVTISVKKIAYTYQNLLDHTLRKQSNFNAFNKMAVVLQIFFVLLHVIAAMLPTCKLTYIFLTV